MFSHRSVAKMKKYRKLARSAKMLGKKYKDAGY